MEFVQELPIKILFLKNNFELLCFNAATVISEP